MLDGIAEPSVKTTLGHSSGDPAQDPQCRAGGSGSAWCQSPGTCGSPTLSSKHLSLTMGRLMVPFCRIESRKD
eukprot:1607704-Pyramimonas_sp.AAC.1